jgi:hypothetical protein
MLNRRRLAIEHAVVPEHVHQHLADGVVCWPESPKVCKRFLRVIDVQHSASRRSNKGRSDLEEGHFLLGLLDGRRFLLCGCK